MSESKERPSGSSQDSGMAENSKKAAWGSLSPDHGSTPKHICKVKLRKFDPLATPKPPKVTTSKKLSPNNDDFWTATDVFVLDEDGQYFGRKVYNEGGRCLYLHIGKKTAKSMQRIKFSDYKAKQIAEFAEKMLIQIDQHKRCGKKDSDPLPYFADDESRVRAFDPKNVREFWAAEPDLETCSVRLRLQFNPRNGNFEFGLLNPVPDDICERFNNWAGPCMWFDTELMTAVLSFINEDPESQE